MRLAILLPILRCARGSRGPMPRALRPGSHRGGRLEGVRPVHDAIHPGRHASAVPSAGSARLVPQWRKLRRVDAHSNSDGFLVGAGFGRGVLRRVQAHQVQGRAEIRPCPRRLQIRRHTQRRPGHRGGRAQILPRLRVVRGHRRPLLRPFGRRGRGRGRVQPICGHHRPPPRLARRPGDPPAGLADEPAQPRQAAGDVHEELLEQHRGHTGAAFCRR
mmetsp:Transcript_127506/g.366799  ORF Transcript_127506/g.366799 Transcript_127506/m.366799 type:complete len:217 (-) Transcript_127506:734-1384(-)